MTVGFNTLPLAQDDSYWLPCPLHHPLGQGLFGDKDFFDHCGVLGTQQDAQQVLSEKKDGVSAWSTV